MELTRKSMTTEITRNGRDGGSRLSCRNIEEQLYEFMGWGETMVLAPRQTTTQPNS